jgi:Domain of unknown function (DUF4124)
MLLPSTSDALVGSRYRCHSCRVGEGVMNTACYTFIKMNVYGLLSLLLWLVLFPAVGTAGLYQWTDAQGNLHITDTPPPIPEKKPAPVVEVAPPVSQFAPQKKTSTKGQTSVGRHQAEIRPVPDLTSAPQSSRNASNHSMLSSLNQAQATTTSPWQVFEGNAASTKAAVQRWTDEKGIEHFVDAAPDTRRR